MKFSKYPCRFIFIAYLCVQSAFLLALDVPPMNGPVNDYAHIFTTNETQELNAYLYNIDRQSDLQIAVLTIPSLEGESIEDYSISVAEKWQIGQKGKELPRKTASCVSKWDTALRIVSLMRKAAGLSVQSSHLSLNSKNTEKGFF